MSLGLIETTLGVFLCYGVSGLGMVGIGMNVMHDANHGTFSSNKKVNKAFALSLNMVGSNAKIWTIQHNVLHHTYTNIDHADDDINLPKFIRVSPNAKQYKIHRYQHIYIWFLYGLTTIFWITIKDFVSVTRYKKMGFVKERMFPSILKIVGWKLLYYTYALVLPLIFAPVEPLYVVLAFLNMHFMVGLFTTVIFQAAHIVPEADFPLPEDGDKIENNWYIHQMQTTANFAQKSRVLSWFIGGLNYQIEHHLFPNISHVHYKKISKIVRDTAKEFNITYHVQGNFIQTVLNHARYLRDLGKPIPQS